MKNRRFIKKRRQRLLKRYHDLANELRSVTGPGGKFEQAYKLALADQARDMLSDVKRFLPAQAALYAATEHLVHPGK